MDKHADSDGNESRPRRRRRVLSVVVVVVGLLALVCFWAKYRFGPPSMSQAPQATQAPQAPQALQALQALQEAHSWYLTAEGDNARGIAFEWLALVLQGYVREGKRPFSVEDIRHYLGEPDAREGPSELGPEERYDEAYWYSFRRQDAREWFLFVPFLDGKAQDFECGVIRTGPVPETLLYVLFEDSTAGGEGEPATVSGSIAYEAGALPGTKAIRIGTGTDGSGSVIYATSGDVAKKEGSITLRVKNDDWDSPTHTNQYILVFYAEGDKRVDMRLDTSAQELVVQGIERGEVVWDLRGSTARFSDNTWHDVVVTYSNDNIHLYTDSVLAGSVAGGLPAVFSRIHVGSDNSGKNLWIGLIDEFAMSDKALTPDMVVDQYRLGQPDLNQITYPLPWVRACSTKENQVEDNAEQ